MAADGSGDDAAAADERTDRRIRVLASAAGIMFVFIQCCCIIA